MIWINLAFFLIIIFMLLFIYSFIEKYLIQIKTYKLNIKKEAFKGFKIIFLSDLHHSEFISRRFIRTITKKVNALNPDLIILGGDYVTSKLKYIKPVFEELKQLKSKYGIYGVIGNHDIDVSKIKTLIEMEKAKIKSLDNDAYWIYHNDDRIKLGGVADYLFDKPDISKTLSGVNDNDYVILVSHNPDYIEKAKHHHIDLMLSGHTHGGQVTLFGLYAPTIPSEYKQKYRSGLKQANNTKIIISNGVGVVGLPIRFFAPPQIIVIEYI